MGLKPLEETQVTMNAPRDYDVIIVGGRPAGSTLAARLGKSQLRVLLLERAEFPSLPAVSSPIIYSSTMRMLDEIGADEAAYARNTPKIHAMSNESPTFSGRLRIPEYEGRDYAYAVDRARFDAALWDTAMRYPTVEGRQGFSVTDLVFDTEGAVMGVVGKPKDGEKETITAQVVIGADGRFGIVARKVNAAVRDVEDEHPTSIYYAYWKNVAPHPSAEPMASAYEGDGATHGFLAMDSADGQTVIALEGRSDVVAPENGDAEGFYLSMLQGNAALWQRAKHGQMVTSVRGMRAIGNSYRQPGGPGWALVGDAYHQKDPLDGQGIYNATLTSKALARSMRRWQSGELSWDETLQEYDEVVRIKTLPMYRNLQQTVQQNFYANGQSPLPPWMMQKLAEYMLTDPQINDLLGRMLTRQLPPEMMTILTPPAMIGAVARGAAKDLRNAGRRLLNLPERS